MVPLFQGTGEEGIEVCRVVGPLLVDAVASCSSICLMVVVGWVQVDKVVVNFIQHLQTG